MKSGVAERAPTFMAAARYIRSAILKHRVTSIAHRLARSIFLVSIATFGVWMWAEATDHLKTPGSSADLTGKCLFMSPLAFVGLSSLAYLVTYWLLSRHPWKDASWARAVFGVVFSGVLILLAAGCLFYFCFAVTFVG